MYRLNKKTYYININVLSSLKLGERMLKIFKLCSMGKHVKENLEFFWYYKKR